MFSAVGIALHDKETWALDEDEEANELADRTLNWARSIDKKKSAVWEKRLATWQPLLSLLMFLVATVLAPRVAATRNKKRVHIPEKQAANNRAPAPVASPTATNNGVPVASRPEQNGGNGHVVIRERSLRREDLQEFFDNDDT